MLDSSRVELPQLVLLAASVKLLLDQQKAVTNAATVSSDPNSPWHDTTGWRPNGQSERSLFFQYENDEDIEVVVSEHDNHFVFHLGKDGQSDLTVIAQTGDNQSLRLHVNNSWERFITLRHENTVLISWKNRWYLLNEFNPFEADISDAAGASTIVAPMPGKLLKVLVSNGDSVTENQPLAILEAMKMEHTLVAPFDGEIDQVFYATDDFVEADATLITFKET